ARPRRGRPRRRVAREPAAARAPADAGGGGRASARAGLGQFVKLSTAVLFNPATSVAEQLMVWSPWAFTVAFQLEPDFVSGRAFPLSVHAGAPARPLVTSDAVTVTV